MEKHEPKGQGMEVSLFGPQPEPDHVRLIDGVRAFGLPLMGHSKSL